MSKTSATEGIAQRALAAAAVQEPSGEKGFGLYAQKVENRGHPSGHFQCDW